MRTSAIGAVLLASAAVGQETAPGPLTQAQDRWFVAGQGIIEQMLALQPNTGTARNKIPGIEVGGFMAPPLKAESTFFVLIKKPMAVCPFCEPGQTWPDDILAVYARRPVEVIPFNVPMRASGVLELGDHVDPELGFYSRVHLAEAT